jgi:uncharacterized protein YbjT (DUF2867 family)
MHIITGGTGNVGAVLSDALLKKNEKVTIVSRRSKNVEKWASKGARVAVADIYDTEAIHEIFKTGNAIFLLNPPADPSTDVETQELKTVDSLLQALKNVQVEKIVVQSTMGAQKGKSIGDLGVLHELEQGVARLGLPYSIIRPAYFMSNWANLLPLAIQQSELISFYPADLKMPMVAPQDIGNLAAELMTKTNTPIINNIEGPEPYSPNDVAIAFSEALNRKVKVTVVPQDEWMATFLRIGFSKQAAESFTGMTEVSLKTFLSPPDNHDRIKGEVSLQHYINDLVKSSK